jgi:hypothetical protein
LQTELTAIRAPDGIINNATKLQFPVNMLQANAFLIILLNAIKTNSADANAPFIETIDFLDVVSQSKTTATETTNQKVNQWVNSANFKKELKAIGKSFVQNEKKRVKYYNECVDNAKKYNKLMHIMHKKERTGFKDALHMMWNGMEKVREHRVRSVQCYYLYKVAGRLVVKDCYKFFGMNEQDKYTNEIYSIFLDKLKSDKDLYPILIKVHSTFTILLKHFKDKASSEVLSYWADPNNNESWAPIFSRVPKGMHLVDIPGEY